MQRYIGKRDCTKRTFDRETQFKTSAGLSYSCSHDLCFTGPRLHAIPVIVRHSWQNGTIPARCLPRGRRVPSSSRPHLLRVDPYISHYCFSVCFPSYSCCLETTRICAKSSRSSGHRCLQSRQQTTSGPGSLFAPSRWLRSAWSRRSETQCCGSFSKLSARKWPPDWRNHCSTYACSGWACGPPVICAMAIESALSLYMCVYMLE